MFLSETIELWSSFPLSPHRTQLTARLRPDMLHEISRGLW